MPIDWKLEEEDDKIFRIWNFVTEHGPSVRVVELVHCSIHLSIWLLIVEMHLCKYQLWFTRSECVVLVQIMLAGCRPLLTVLSFCDYAGWTVCCSV